MSWNEPGRGNRDPWGGSDNQGPPDLDEVIRKVKGKVGGLFGGKGGSSGNDGSGGGGGLPSGNGSRVLIGVVAGVFLLIWLASGIYIVDEGWRGVERRFGAFERTTAPGMHWHPPSPIGSVNQVNVETVRISEIGYTTGPNNQRRHIDDEALMLTQDENIVDVQLAVQYRVDDPEAYVFNFRSPDQTLKDMAESALREVVGKRRMDFVLTEGRTEVARETRRLVSEAMQDYGTGLTVLSVDLQDVQPPEQVQGAFEDAIMAREDEQRKINQANAYRNEIIPRAQGEAARIRAEAEGYRQRVIAEAEGESDRFLAQLREYSEVPEVTRTRLYLDAVSELYSGSRKVLMSGDTSDSLLYLPLDRMRGGSSGSGGSGSNSAGVLNQTLLDRRLSSNDAQQGSDSSRSRGQLRSRENR